ncbi:MAG: DUF58 domain-containing protein [Spirochaetia bacterium]
MSRPASDPGAVLQRLDWTVFRRLDGLLQGDYRTLFRGFGVELAELREYQLTDDVRSIDWNVTARMQTPYVRQFMEDRELTAWFLLDMSPSVDFGSPTMQKRTLLESFTAALARLLTRHGNKVGAVLYNGEKERIVPSAGGRMHVLSLINEMQRMPRLKRAPMTNLSSLLAMAAGMLRRRSLVFLVSDFLSVPGWEGPLRSLARQHEVIAVALSDPRERELPDIGPIVFEDAETGEQLFLDTHDRGFRRRFAASAVARGEQRDALLRASGVDLLPLSTDGDLARDIVRFAAARRQRRMSPGSRPAPLPRAAREAQ